MADEGTSSTPAPQGGTSTPPADLAAQLEKVVEQQSQPGVPAGLEKFAGEGGKLDAEKLAQSYLEAEKTLRVSQQESAQLRQAFQAVAERLPQSQATPRQAVTPPSSDDLLRQFVERPKEFVAGIVQEMGAPLAEEMSKAALLQVHPELRDKVFTADLQGWLKTVPEAVRRGEETFEGADYLIKMYKREKGVSAQNRQASTPAAPSSEAPSNQGGSSGGRTFTRDQIRNLIKTNPAEYARLSPEISKAYKEGRVN